MGQNIVKYLHKFISSSINHRPNLIKILSNIGWLAIDRLLRMATGLFVGVWIARYLGPEQFGLLSFATAFVGLFGAIAALGLNAIVVRDIVRDPSIAAITLGTAAFLQLIGGIISFLAILTAISIVRPDDILTRSIVAILGSITLLKASEVTIYWFESQVKSKYTVIAQNIAFFSFSVIKVILIVQQAPLIAFAWAMLGEAVTTAIFLLSIFNRKGQAISSLRASTVRAKSLLIDSWPLILSALAVSLSMRIDQVMIGQMLDDALVGQYSIGVRLAEVFILPGVIVASSIFPRMLGSGSERFNYEFVRFVRYPFYALSLMAVIFSINSELSIVAIFGDSYRSAAPAFSILIFSIPLTYISILSTKYLLIKGLHAEIFKRQIVGLLANVILNIVMIPKYGIVGAAMATVLTDLMISIGADIGRKDFRDLLQLKMQAIFIYRV